MEIHLAPLYSNREESIASAAPDDIRRDLRRGLKRLDYRNALTVQLVSGPGARLRGASCRRRA